MRIILWRINLTALLLMATVAHAQWQHAPVGTPTLTRVAGDTAGTHFVIATDAAGFWHTTNGGAQWLPRNNVEPELPVGQVGTLTCGNATGTLLAAGIRVDNDEEFIRSTDGGATWLPIGYAIYGPGDIVISRQNPQHWLYAGLFNVQYSGDGGVHWMHLASTLPPVQKLVHDPVEDSVIYAMNVPDFEGQRTGIDHVYRTTDFGQSWTTLFAADSALSPAPDALWLSTITRTSGGRLFIPATVYMEGQDRPVLVHSADSGATWQLLELADRIPGLTGALRDLLEDRTHPGTLLLAGRVTGGVARSTDNGQSWATGLSGLPADTVLDTRLYQNPCGGPVLALLDNRAPYRSDDGGLSWQAVEGPPVGAPWGNFSVTPAAMFFFTYYWSAGGTDALMQWKYDGDGDWQPLAPLPAAVDTAFDPYPVFYARGDSLFARLDLYPYSGTRRHCLAISGDNGASWTRGPLLDEDMFGLHAVFTAEGFDLYSLNVFPPVLKRSRDRGLTWESAILLAHGGPSGTMLWAQNDEQLCVLLDTQPQSSLYRSLDGGTHWNLLDLPVSGALPVTDLHVWENDILLVGNGYCLRRHGGAWDTTGTLLPGNTYAHSVLVPATPPILMSIVSEREIWYSRDFGASWQNLLFLYPFPLAQQQPPLYNLTYDPYRQRVWVSAGIGPCYFDVAALPAENEPVTLYPADYTVLSCYPNPFNSTARIRYDLLQPGRVELTLYDLQGRLVKTLVDEVAGAGRHERMVDGSGLASGTYFVHLRTPTASRTQKILLLK